MPRCLRLNLHFIDKGTIFAISGLLNISINSRDSVNKQNTKYLLMKRFLLYLSALFLSVSFATAQTSYVISESTGILTNGNNTTKSSTWSSTELAGFTLVSDFGEAMNVNNGLQLYAYNNGKVIYTINAPEGYSISAYTIKYKKGSSSYTITLSAEGVEPQTPGRVSSEQTFEVTGLSGASAVFALEGTLARDFIKNVNITVTLQEVGGEAPVEYAVSATASPAEGGVVTVNDAEGETTTTGKVDLNAVPAYGYKFVRWTVDGNEVSTAAQYTTAVNSDVQYVAVFEKPTDANDWYASIAKPSFGKAGNTTFVKVGTLTGDVNVEVAGIQAVAGQACVTNAIEVAAGAEFDLNITYQLNWGDLAIYQIDNDGATKEYGYYYGSWEPNGSTEKVAQNIADGGVSVTEVVDGACTATFPITINENHNPGDVIVVRAITGVTNNATNSAFEQNIVEGGYVDFLFVVADEKPAEDTSEWSTFYQPYPVAPPEGVNTYIVTAAASDYVTLTRFEGTIPANTAVILNNGEPKGEAVDVDFSTNLLKGTTVGTYIDEEAYVLSKVDGVVGFYKAEMVDGTWLNNANKAYLPASVVPNKSAAFYGFDWEGTTGIDEVKGENGNVKVIYDLTGRRVEAITVPGIYIVNGVKKLVR